jgi:hypothetical protein
MEDKFVFLGEVSRQYELFRAQGTPLKVLLLPPPEVIPNSEVIPDNDIEAIPDSAVIPDNDREVSADPITF